LPQNRVSVGLSRKVICPVCGEEGILTARQRGRKWYLYVRHPVKEGNRWKVYEHYIGPARLFYDVESKILMRPLARIKCIAEPMRDGEATSEEPFIAFTPVLFKKEEGDISRLRQTAIDYASILTWFREIIDRSIEDLKKGFGITDEEISDRLRELKGEFIIMRFYRKP